MLTCCYGIASLLFLVPGPLDNGHVWTDATGKYSTEAALVDFDQDTVVLKKNSGRLIAVPIAKLSKTDQEYLRSQAAATTVQEYSGGKRTWTMLDGEEVVGNVLDFCQTKVVIQRQLGRILVNDKPYQDLSKLHQYVVRKIVEHISNTSIKDHSDLERWAIKQKDQPREFDCNGVLLELEDHEEAAVPFFIFSREDEDLLKPGWEHWVAQKNTLKKEAQANSEALAARQRQESLFLRARARDYQRDQLTRQMVQLMTIDAGLSSEWRVQLYPKAGTYGSPMQVFVSGWDTNDARREAIANYPDYFVGPISKVGKRWQ
jgi:hypothetical protein